MKKLLLLIVSVLLFVETIQAEHIRLSTKGSTLLISATHGKSPRFRYFGARLNDVDNPFDAGIAFNEALYPEFGAQCAREMAIQATHPDGNQSLELVVESVERRSENGAHITAIHTKDKHYPFYVTVFYKTYDDCEVIETWTEMRHTEKRPVTLYRFASAFLPIRRGTDNWISHFHGSWGAEGYLEEEPLIGGMKVIRNKDGVRNTQTDNPSFMYSLDGKPQELSGRVIGGTLAWGGNYRIAFANDNSNLTRIFVGINEEQSHYILEPKEVFTTPVFAFTYSNEGKSGVSRNIHRWARLHRLNHGTALRPILLNSWEGVYFKVNKLSICQPQIST